MESLTSEQKEQEWEEMAARVDKVTDGLGKPVDAGIKEAVIVLNLSGFGTSASCEGHLAWGVGGPWVDIVPQGIEGLLDRYHHALVAIDKAHKQEKTKEQSQHLEALYEEMRGIHKEAEEPLSTLGSKLLTCLAAFYQDRLIPYERMLVFHPSAMNYRLECYGAYLEKKIADLPPRAETLLGYQEEMRAFTAFLKARYYAS